MEVVHLLALRKIGQILAVEPHIEKMPASLAAFGNIELVSSKEAIRRANIIVMLVSHRSFYAIDRRLLEGKHVIDTRGVWQ
jgi:UDP-N-acetyl-D-mannosaminuronic acid dehydrogenase